MTSTYLKKKDLRERFGWSPTTVWRKVKQGCFPCYRLSHNDVRFKLEDVIHHIEGTSCGGFSYSRPQR